MKCPSCGFPDSKVVDSRPIEDGSSIRRRRECASCGKRFTTFEVIDHIQVLVCKKDGTKELFDRSKLLSGLMKACQKRPVDAEAITAEIGECYPNCDVDCLMGGQPLYYYLISVE